MNPNKILPKILGHPVFREKPPVLLDIGASGKVHEAWRPIARQSICLAFDPDDRKMGYIEKEQSDYRKLLVYPAIVTESTQGNAEFHLTRSPYCSSLLLPDTEKLGQWAFQGLFDLEKSIELPATTLEKALSETGLDYIDWYKSDAQGVDLRLFASLPASIRHRISLCEFEPGIQSFYRGEDKLGDLLAFMENEPFWMSDLHVCGTQRIHKDSLSAKPFQSVPRLNRMVRSSPGWANTIWLHEEECLDVRGSLMLLITAILQKQYGVVHRLLAGLADSLKDFGYDETRNWLEASIRWRQKTYLPVAALKKIAARIEEWGR
jgi:hypothetical protein